MQGSIVMNLPHLSQKTLLSIGLILLAFAAQVFATNGELDPSFQAGLTGAGAAVFDFAYTPDGKIIAVGNFPSADGLSNNCIAMLDAASGRVIGSFGIGPSNHIGLNLVECNGAPSTVAIQPLPGGDYRIIVAGNFSNFGQDDPPDPTHYRAWIAGLTSSGDIDRSFIGLSDLGPQGEMTDLYVLPDRSVLLASFNMTNVNTGTVQSPVPNAVGHFTKLDPNGNFDSEFNTNLGTGFDGATASIAVDSVGNIYVGGAFGNVNNAPRQFIAKLLPDGSVDPVFSANLGLGPNGAVGQVAVDSLDRVYIAGGFAPFNGSPGGGLVRMSSAGVVDPTFDSHLNGPGVGHISIDSPNGKLLATGTSMDDGVNSRTGVVLLNLSNGSIDPGFTLPNASSLPITGVELHAGMYTIGGAPGLVGPLGRFGLSRFDATGAVDAAFAPVLGQIGAASVVKVLSDDSFLVGGRFDGANGAIYSRLAHFNADGTIDTTFAAGTQELGIDGEVNVIEIDTSNSDILVAGTFARYGGASHSGIVRLNSNGVVDATFNGSVLGVKAIAIQPDRKIVIAGVFTTVNGVTGFGGIARLNADGTTDTNFTPSGTTCFACHVNSVVLDSTGIVVGGTFTDFNGQSNVNRIARLSMSNGALDTTYLTNSGTGFDAAVLDLDVRLGKVTAVGAFSNYNGVSGSRIARIKADGSPDPSLDAGTGFDADVERITIRPDGTMLVIGYAFSQYNGHLTWHGVAKIRTNGNFDASFAPSDNQLSGTFEGTIYDIGAQATGGDIVVGNFSTWGWNPGLQFGSPRFSIVRLTDTPSNVWKPEGTFQATSNDGLPGEHRGCSVATSGDTAVVGTCPPFDSTGPSIPDAYVYVRVGNVWQLQQELRIPGTFSNRERNNVAILDDTIVISEPLLNNPDFWSGGVFVFQRTNGVWAFERELSPPARRANMRFGQSISIARDTFIEDKIWLAVGSPEYFGNQAGGAVIPYFRSGGTWFYVDAYGAPDPGPTGFGTSVAIDRDFLIVGAPYEDVGGDDSQGKVYLLQRQPSNEYQIIDEFTASDGAENDYFGEAVTMNEFDILIGAPQRNNRGAVYHFSRDSDPGEFTESHIFTDPNNITPNRFGTALGIARPSVSSYFALVGVSNANSAVVTEQGSVAMFSLFTGATVGQIRPSSASPGAHFGSAIAAGGGFDTAHLLVGSPGDDVGGVNDQGSGEYFQLTASGGTSIQKLVSQDDPSGDEFGSAVAIDDDWAVMGAPGDDIRGTADQGSVYVYHGVPADFYYGASWTFKQKLISTDGTASDRFGTSVAFGVHLLIVGAPGGNGAAYVYEKETGNTPWSPMGKIVAPDTPGGSFGGRVAAAGDYLFVSAYSQNGNDGAVYVFRADTTNNQITYISKLKDTSVAGFKQFGYGLAASGNVLLVGEPGIDGHKGAVITFKRSHPFGPYIAQPRVTAPDGVSFSRFGEAIAVSGDQALVGSPTADVDGAADRGAIYAYTINGSGTPVFNAKLTAFDGTAGDNFGISVSISGDAAIVGASFADPNSHPDQGAAYTFQRARGTWSEKNKLVNPQGLANDQMGMSVSINGPSVLVGARSSNILPGRPKADRSYGSQPNGGVFGYGFAPLLVPSAANVTISGRVTDSNGNGVTNARVTALDAGQIVFSAVTNPFGYFAIEGITAGQSYVVMVSSKKYSFAARVVLAQDDITDMDFIADPRKLSPAKME